MTTLVKASNQWMSRSPDERYDSIEAMHEAACRVRSRAATAATTTRELHATAYGDEVVLNGRADRRAALTHYSFGQLASKAGAPANYLRTLPAAVAADCINHGLSQEDRDVDLLFSRYDGGELQLRSMHSDRYARIWNSDITERLVALKADGPWQEAPAGFDGSRGQYMSDRDMFSFFVDSGRRIFEKDPNGGLSRGFFAWNSEVGAKSFGIMTFLYEYVCGNHMVWGAKDVKELRIRHIGDADTRAFAELNVRLIEYANGAASEDELMIQRARDYQLGKTKDEVLAAIFGLKLMPKKTVEEAYELATKREDWYGSPRSAWGMRGAITEIARDLPYADERVALESAGKKVMELAF